MALIEWNNNLSVKVTELDLQHQKLIDLINELHEAMRTGKSKEVMSSIIDGLVSYTKTHFAHEEKYFALHQYPGTILHKKEHEKFVVQVVDFQEKFESGKMFLSIEIMNFLKEWLVKHIQGTDQQYSDFFNKKGIK